jgi:hypothetical protein
MNATIYATILTGLGIVITLVVTMHNLAKANQQETYRRIDELKKAIKENLDAQFRVVDSQFKMVDSQFKMVDSRFEVVNVKFQKVEDVVAEVKQDVQDVKRVIFRPTP